MNVQIVNKKFKLTGTLVRTRQMQRDMHWACAKRVIVFDLEAVPGILVISRPVNLQGEIRKWMS